MTFCGCGKRMYVPSNTPKYVCPKCRNKTPITDLEAVFHEQLKGFFFSPDEVAGYLAQADKTIKDKKELLRTLQSEAAKVREEMDRNGSISPTISPSKASADREVDFLKIQYLSSNEILSEAMDLWTKWPTLPAEGKRQVIENITESVVSGKGEVAIHLCYLPSPSEDVAKRANHSLEYGCHGLLNT